MSTQTSSQDSSLSGRMDGCGCAAFLLAWAIVFGAGTEFLELLRALTQWLIKH